MVGEDPAVRKNDQAEAWALRDRLADLADSADRHDAELHQLRERVAELEDRLRVLEQGLRDLGGSGPSRW